MQATVTQAFFDHVGQRYEDGFGHDKGLQDFIMGSLQRLHQTPETRVLDVGQGTGKPTSSLVAQAGCQVHGIDLSPVMVNLARKNVPNGTFEAIDMLDYSPVEPFDAVFAIFSHFQLLASDVPDLVQKYSEWVRPSGFLFIGTMAADDFPRDQYIPEVSDGSVGRVVRKFMGVDSSLLVITRTGWKAMLEAKGFELLHADMTTFQAPPEAGCDMEPHYYLTCRKTTLSRITGGLFMQGL